MLDQCEPLACAAGYERESSPVREFPIHGRWAKPTLGVKTIVFALPAFNPNDEWFD